MNNNLYYPVEEYSYSPKCPYKDTCPVWSQCPFCPHQMESPVEPGYYGNTSPEMGTMGNGYPEYPYEDISPEQYEYNPHYPMADNMQGTLGMESYNHANVNSMYNQFGYINPTEEMNSPWDNNRMFMDQNPLPIPCPFR